MKIEIGEEKLKIYGRTGKQRGDQREKQTNKQKNRVTIPRDKRLPMSDIKDQWSDSVSSCLGDLGFMFFCKSTGLFAVL